MTCRSLFLVLLLAVVSRAATAGATDNDVFAYDNDVAGRIDVDRFERAGDVTFFDGSGTVCASKTGPAPAPYPPIRFLGPSFEQLGKTDTGMDGILFFTNGSHDYWKKNAQVLVLWKVRIPSANVRSPLDFEGDLTLSMWVDWDQNEAWDWDELVVRKTVHVGDYLPTGGNDIYLHYLTGFRVPDISRSGPMSGESRKNHDRELTYLWVRGSLSYDNPVASPDGDQLYGAFVDYRIGYRVNPNRDKVDGEGD